MPLKNRQEIGAANADAQVELVHRLKEIRTSNGIQVSEVAETMGVDSAMVYRFERGGTNFTAATLRKYAKAVGALLKLDAINISNVGAVDSFFLVDSQDRLSDTVFDEMVATQRFQGKGKSRPPSRETTPPPPKFKIRVQTKSTKLVIHK